MKPILKPSIFLAALMGAFSVSAAQKDITVTADIDPTAAITKADGNALPDTIALHYLPGSGIRPYTEQVKLWSNASGKTLEVKLGHTPELTRLFGGSPTIPLSVSLNGNALTTTKVDFSPDVLFPGGEISSGSIVMPLIISQTTYGTVDAAGIYQGIVSIIVSQATT